MLAGRLTRSSAPVLALSPAKLILLDRSEPALYAIEHELRLLLPDGVVLLPALGSATDLHWLQRLFVDQQVELVFHAALTSLFPSWRPIRWRALPITFAPPIGAAACEPCSQVVLISTDKLFDLPTSWGVAPC